MILPLHTYSSLQLLPPQLIYQILIASILALGGLIGLGLLYPLTLKSRSPIKEPRPMIPAHLEGLERVLEALEEGDEGATKLKEAYWSLRSYLLKEAIGKIGEEVAEVEGSLTERELLDRWKKEGRMNRALKVLLELYPLYERVRFGAARPSHDELKWAREILNELVKEEGREGKG